MFEIVLIIVVAGGIATYARARGGNPTLWGGIGIGGYAFINYVVPVILASLNHPLNADSRMWLFGIAAAWVAVVAFCARFLLGSSLEKPSGMWSCPNCRYLNQPFAVVCEACRQPYANSTPTA